MNNVKHCAKVIEVGENTIKASIEQLPACATCKAQTTCGIHKGKQKVFEVECGNAASKYKVGDNVTLSTSLNTARKAVIVAFIVPLLLFVIALFLSKSIFKSEFWGILCGFISLIVYYTYIYIVRDKISKSFKIHID